LLEQIKYINHLNEVVEFGKNGLFVNENDLHDFTWKVTSKNDRISSFTKGVTKFSLPVVIKCSTEEEGVALKNRLFELCEKDVLANKYGRFVIGEYYLKCFITGSKVSDYSKGKSYATQKLTIQTDQPYWIKEIQFSFSPDAIAEGSNLDFNNDFPYDYASNILYAILNNNNFVASNFRMNIYGIASNPTVTISGHDYTVNTTIGSNEYLTIDSIEKTIILTRKNGEKVNCFNLRDKDSYIFEKIPSGTCTVAMNGDFRIDITLLEERGVPKWT